MKLKEAAQALASCTPDEQRNALRKMISGLLHFGPHGGMAARARCMSCKTEMTGADYDNSTCPRCGLVDEDNGIEIGLRAT